MIIRRLTAVQKDKKLKQNINSQTVYSDTNRGLSKAIVMCFISPSLNFTFDSN